MQDPGLDAESEKRYCYNEHCWKTVLNEYQTYLM